MLSPCYKCGSADLQRITMTPDEKRFGMDIFQCRVCQVYQNHAGEEDGKRAFLGVSNEADNTIVIDGTMPKSLVQLAGG